MKLKLFILQALAVCSIAAQAQVDSDVINRVKEREKNISGKNKTNNKKVTKKSTTTSVNEYNNVISPNVSPAVANQSDSAYYLHVTRRHGWYVGIGPKLTKEHASHLPCYYKLSNKNQKGNWTLIQSYEGSGNLTTYNDINTYLINKYDTQDEGANSEWRNKLQEVCQLVSIASYDGKNCIQEQGLDKKGNVVYSMIITQIGPNNFGCTYINQWGQPVYMRTDNEGNDLGNASYVEVVRDSMGYDMQIRYFNRNGFPVKNRNGSYMLGYIRDKNGNAVKAIPQDLLGNPMIDDWGSSSEKNTFDKYGNKLISRSFGLDGEPAQSRGTYGFWNKYDGYGRLIETGDLDEKGNKCSDKDDVFKYVFEYNNDGSYKNYAKIDRKGRAIKDNLDDISDTLEMDSLEDYEEIIHTTASTDDNRTSEHQEQSISLNNNEERDSTVYDPITRSVTTYKFKGNTFNYAYVCRSLDDINHDKSIMYLITQYGAHARTGYAYYYKAILGKDFMGNETMMGVNEFGEPAYVTDADAETAFIYSFEKDGRSIDYDESFNEKTKEEMDSLLTRLPRVYCIEVIDTTKAYPMGILNNDIIIQYGDWRICKDLLTGVNKLPSMIDKKRMDKPDNINMTILRHYPNEKRSKIIELELGSGSLRDLGCDIHLIYYTQLEKKRLCETANSAGFIFGIE